MKASREAGDSSTGPPGGFGRAIRSCLDHFQGEIVAQIKRSHEADMARVLGATEVVGINAVGGISDVIHVPGLVNVDFEDVKTVMSEPGKAMMGTAQAGGPRKKGPQNEQPRPGLANGTLGIVDRP